MTQFTMSNMGYEYEQHELDEMNRAFKTLHAEIRYSAYDHDSYLAHIAEQVKTAYDEDLRGDELIARAKYYLQWK